MSTELICDITVGRDGVYICSHNSDDGHDFQWWRCEKLSAAYDAEGQVGLDREVIRMLYECASLCGPSMNLCRYKYALKSQKAREMRSCYNKSLEKKYPHLFPDLRKKLSLLSPSEKKKCWRFERSVRYQMYDGIAGLCQEFDIACSAAKGKKKKGGERNGG